MSNDVKMVLQIDKIVIYKFHILTETGFVKVNIASIPILSTL